MCSHNSEFYTACTHALNGTAKRTIYSREHATYVCTDCLDKAMAGIEILDDLRNVCRTCLRNSRHRSSTIRV